MRLPRPFRGFPWWLPLLSAAAAAAITALIINSADPVWAADSRVWVPDERLPAQHVQAILDEPQTFADAMELTLWEQSAADLAAATSMDVEGTLITLRVETHNPALAEQMAASLAEIVVDKCYERNPGPAHPETLGVTWPGARRVAPSPSGAAALAGLGGLLGGLALAAALGRTRPPAPPSTLALLARQGWRPLAIIPAPDSVTPAPPTVIPAQAGTTTPPTATPAPPPVTPAPPTVIPAQAGTPPAPEPVIPAQAGTTTLPSATPTPPTVTPTPPTVIPAPLPVIPAQAGTPPPSAQQLADEIEAAPNHGPVTAFLPLHHDADPEIPARQAARALAGRGRDILWLDARPPTPTLLTLPNNLLNPPTPFHPIDPNAPIPTWLQGLPIPPKPEQLRTLIANNKPRFDAIILLLPPVIPAPPSVIPAQAGTLADRIALTARDDYKPTPNQIAQLAAQLPNNIPILGIALTHASPDRAKDFQAAADHAQENSQP